MPPLNDFLILVYYKMTFYLVNIINYSMRKTSTNSKIQRKSKGNQSLIPMIIWADSD